jgi:hypothetical protein
MRRLVSADPHLSAAKISLARRLTTHRRTASRSRHRTHPHDWARFTAPKILTKALRDCVNLT